MITEIIKECLEKGILICLILDLSDWETVIIGKVLSFDDKNILINEVNPYGKIIRKKRKIKISQIKVLSHSDIYGKDLDFLHSNALINYSKAKYIYFGEDKRSCQNKLKKFIENKKIISIFINDEYVIGIIVNQNDNDILINNYSYQGLDDGFSLFKHKLITKIRYDGPVEQKIEALKNLKNNEEHFSSNIGNCH